MIALKNIDAIITLIKKSADREEAKQNLIKKFELTERQAVAILEMRFQTLAGLERKKIEDELKEILELIKELTLILKSPERLKGHYEKRIAGIERKIWRQAKNKGCKRKIGRNDRS